MTKYSIMAVTKEGKSTQEIKNIFVLHPTPLDGLFFFILVFPQREGLYTRSIYHFLYQPTKQILQSTSYRKVNCIILSYLRI